MFRVHIGLATLIEQRIQALGASITEVGAVVALLPGGSKQCKGKAIPEGFPTITSEKAFTKKFKALLPDVKPKFQAIRGA